MFLLVGGYYFVHFLGVFFVYGLVGGGGFEPLDTLFYSLNEGGFWVPGGGVLFNFCVVEDGGVGLVAEEVAGFFGGYLGDEV